MTPYLFQSQSLRGICSKNSFDQVFSGVTNSNVREEVSVGPNVLVGLLNGVALKRWFPV